MSDLDRFYELLTTGTGVQRIKHPRLEGEADERAFEARQQVGLNVHPGDPEADKIIHPPQSVREARLGPEWHDLQVVEVASWLYQWLDPIQALVDDTARDGRKVGLLNSAEHRAILDDPSFTHWGAGLYDELPPGEPELERRYYGIAWLSRGVPVPAPKQSFKDVKPSDPFYADIEWAAQLGIAKGYPDGTFGPNDPVTRAQMMAFLRRALT